AGAAKRRENHPEHARFSANQSTTCAGSVSDGRSATTPEHGSAAAESCSPHQHELQIQDRRSQTWEWWTLTPRPPVAAPWACKAAHAPRNTKPRSNPHRRTETPVSPARRSDSSSRYRRGGVWAGRVRPRPEMQIRESGRMARAAELIAMA